MNNVGRGMARAVRRSAGATGMAAGVTVIAERDWMSALFEGVRVTLEVTARDDGLDGWLAALPDADLPLSDGFVASAEVVDRPRAGVATIEILAIAE